jgi:Protein of unknown function (DUF1549)/Protein of unknown function (DUF1553)
MRVAQGSRDDMGIRDLLFVGLIVGGASLVGVSLYPKKVEVRPDIARAVANDDSSAARTVTRVNEAFRKTWAESKLGPAPPAPTMLLLRRSALALTGSIPSLEEIRRIETLPEAERTARYVDDLLNDRRFADYFAERFARAFVGTEGGPFLVFRRRRFVSWLSDKFAENAPYDQIAREVIATDGLWTDHPATNFLTVTYDPDRKVVDAERLAGRVSRAFLGARIDCAQCHDHPFAPWKQKDFMGLAAFFGQTQSGFTGLHEEKGDFEFVDRKTGKKKQAEPGVPNHPELLPPPTDGNRREQLARWLTHPKNPAFAHATVNRVWALMFGKPLVEPIDDIPADEVPEALDILAKDFVENGYNLRRLVQLIAATQVFQLDSATDAEASGPVEKAWAAFPMTRLRPEQVVGSVFQAASLTTLNAETHILFRLINSGDENNFVKRFGDSGEDEFDSRGGTIPQRLLMLNGELISKRTKDGFLNGITQIGYFAPTDEAAVEIAYLTILSRKPTPEERGHFQAKLAGTKGDVRSGLLSDLFWTLVNATEFSWNH